MPTPSFSYHYQGLSNEIMHDVLSHGTSKLSELEDLNFPFYLVTTAFFLKNLMLLEIEYHTVPHLKVLNSGIEHSRGMGMLAISYVVSVGQITLKSLHNCKLTRNECPQV